MARDVRDGMQDEVREDGGLEFEEGLEMGCVTECSRAREKMLSRRGMIKWSYRGVEAADQTAAGTELLHLTRPALRRRFSGTFLATTAAERDDCLREFHREGHGDERLRSNRRE
jgi:hypothetical protein